MAPPSTALQWHAIVLQGAAMAMGYQGTAMALALLGTARHCHGTAVAPPLMAARCTTEAMPCHAMVLLDTAMAMGWHGPAMALALPGVAMASHCTAEALPWFDMVRHGSAGRCMAIRCQGTAMTLEPPTAMRWPRRCHRIALPGSHGIAIGIAMAL